MGFLDEKVKLSLLTGGNGLADNYKNNSLKLMDNLSKTSDDFKAINVTDIKSGNFYFIQYKDPSNWMKWSPIFLVDWKKFGNQIILRGVNFNFIPLEIRVAIFDQYIDEKIFDGDLPLKVDWQGMYNELLKWGFEYALVEYNAIQIILTHKVSMNYLPKFLMSGHPLNKYDPDKLIQIWTKKLETRDKRHNEMMNALLSDFYDMKGEIKEQYDALKGHIQRIQLSLRRF